MVTLRQKAFPAGEAVLPSPCHWQYRFNEIKQYCSFLSRNRIVEKQEDAVTVFLIFATNILYCKYRRALRSTCISLTVACITIAIQNHLKIIVRKGCSRTLAVTCDTVNCISGIMYSSTRQLPFGNRHNQLQTTPYITYGTHFYVHKAIGQCKIPDHIFCNISFYARTLLVPRYPN
jgi:hypothetical protein